MFGRNTERAQIEQMLEGVAGGPTGVALEGSPGIGKTTLWGEGVAGARHRRYQVITTTPAEPDAALAFAGLGDLFDQVPDETLAALPDPQRRALDAALFKREAAQAPGDPAALPRAALGLLRQLAESAPLLVAIDDEQWLDRSSARVLAFALCRLREERICVLLARRRRSDGALWPELERGFGPHGLRALIVEQLDMREIHELLADQLGTAIPRPLLRRVYEASGGNPLYALAIARELEATGANGVSGAELPIPRTLADAVGQRLERLDDRAADPLLVVAAVSNPTLALIQSVLPEFTLSDLESAERAGVIEASGDRLRFTHPLLASTHYLRTPSAHRRDLHRLLAEVVADGEERAHHLALGAEAPSRQIAMKLEQAAQDAARRGSPEVAAELLEHACRLTPADAVQAAQSRTVAAAEQHWSAGDFARARKLLETLLQDVSGGPIRARALMQLAQIRTDDFDVASALLQEALVQARDHDRVCAQIELRLAEVAFNRGDQAGGVEHGERAVQRAERAGDPGLLAGALGSQAMAAFFHGQGVQLGAMTRAIEIEEPTDEISSYYRASASLGRQLMWSDQLDAARPLLEGMWRRAIECGEESDRGGLVFHLAHLEWEAGNNELAERYTTDLVEATRQQADVQGESYLLWLRAFVACRRGEFGEAHERAGDAVELASRIGDQFIIAFSTAILAETELRTGKPESAHQRLPPVREMLSGVGGGFVGSLTLPVWWCDVEALIATGRLDDAGRVLGELFERGRRSENPNATAIAHRCRGLLLAAQGEPQAAIEALDAALVQHALRPLPLELGRTQLEKGTLERRAKRKSAAKRSLEQALQALEPLNAGFWVARARDELGRIGLRGAVVSEGLTPAQQRVAELVAEGMSNPEIASSLYMSLRTVESHLTKVYRELGVRNRSQLVGAIATRRAETDADNLVDKPSR